MSYPFTEAFMAQPGGLEYLRNTMMGPNAMRIAEELASYLDIRPGALVLDLGCGNGLSTVLLSKQYGATVFAADLWVSPSDNYERFQELGIAGNTVPLFVDATKGLPFAYGYFDILFSVDAYHYFGDTPKTLSMLMRYIKPGGYLAIAVPGLKQEFAHGVPPALKPFWQKDMSFHSLDWWKELWGQTEGIEIVQARAMDCCGQAWAEWLACPNPYATEDIPLIEADNGQYFNLVQMIAKVV